jgi:DNA-binding NarL/FixJ family response regulator
MAKLKLVPQEDTPFTPRELEVIKLAAEGESNEDIALLLGCAKNTVKTHITTIRVKLGVHSKAEAVAVCLREGYIR